MSCKVIYSVIEQSHTSSQLYNIYCTYKKAKNAEKFLHRKLNLDFLQVVRLYNKTLVVTTISPEARFHIMMYKNSILNQIKSIKQFEKIESLIFI
jgi:hypothetical protein